MCNEFDEVQLITIKKLAAILDIGERTAWRYLSAGKLPKPIRLGRLVRWDKAVIHSWVDAGTPDQKIWEAMKKRGSKF